MAMAGRMILILSLLARLVKLSFRLVLVLCDDDKMINAYRIKRKQSVRVHRQLVEKALLAADLPPPLASMAEGDRQVFPILQARGLFVPAKSGEYQKWVNPHK